MKASKSETEAAEYLGRTVREYGPVSRGQVLTHAQGQAEKYPRLSHGLTALYREMRDDEKVTGRAAPRALQKLRRPARGGRSR